jgi:hypothetical protein
MAPKREKKLSDGLGDQHYLACPQRPEEVASDGRSKVTMWALIGRRVKEGSNWLTSSVRTAGVSNLHLHNLVP